MTSVNTALEVDLFGQANASRINARIYSGFGGQTDFIVGALHSAGWAVVHRAALLAPQGRRVDHRAAPRRAGDELPAERRRHRARHGGAVGATEQAQCQHIIGDAAHPQVRDELREEAHALGLA